MLKDLAITGVVILLLDSIFLYSMGPLFKHQIEKVQQSPFRMNYFGAILAYVLLIFGLYWFIIKENKGLIDAFLLGIVIYGVYEGTTKALLKKWDYKTMIIDTLWGGILMSLTTLIVYRVKNMNALM
jgi:uncharacterized membrane protein